MARDKDYSNVATTNATFLRFNNFAIDFFLTTDILYPSANEPTLTQRDIL